MPDRDMKRRPKVVARRTHRYRSRYDHRRGDKVAIGILAMILLILSIASLGQHVLAQREHASNPTKETS